MPEIVEVTVLALVIFGIGWITGRRISHRAALAAAGIAAFSLIFALALQFATRFDGSMYFFSQSGRDMAVRAALMLLAVPTVGAGVAALGAALGQLRRRRA